MRRFLWLGTTKKVATTINHCDLFSWAIRIFVFLYFLLEKTLFLTRLAVGKNTGVISLERIVQNVSTQSVEHDVLAREMLGPRIQREETMIERKGFWFVPEKLTKLINEYKKFGLCELNCGFRTSKNDEKSRKKNVKIDVITSHRFFKFPPKLLLSKD